MGFLTRDQLFLVFVVVTLVDMTTAFREVYMRNTSFTIGMGIAIAVLLFDMWVIWKLAWLTEADKPSPSYAVSN